MPGPQCVRVTRHPDERASQPSQCTEHSAVRRAPDPDPDAHTVQHLQLHATSDGHACICHRAQCICCSARTAPDERPPAGHVQLAVRVPASVPASAPARAASLPERAAAPVPAPAPILARTRGHAGRSADALELAFLAQVESLALDPRTSVSGSSSPSPMSLHMALDGHAQGQAHAPVPSLSLSLSLSS